jgi:predicted transcriptional regulator
MKCFFIIVYQVCFGMVRDNLMELKFNWTHQPLIFVDDIGLLDTDINTIKKTEAKLDVSSENAL